MANSETNCLGTLLKWATFGLILVTGLCYAAPYFPPGIFPPFIFLGMAFPMVVILNAILVGIWVFLKKWYAIMPLLCLVMCWEGVDKFFGNPFQADAEPSNARILNVMTYNAQNGGIYRKGDEKPFLAFMKKHDPDVVCFQEVHVSNSRFAPMMANYPYFVQRPGQAIISKYPIVQDGDLELEKTKTSNGAIWADVNVDGHTLRVYNLHLRSNKVSGKVDDLAENTEVDDLQDKETWSKTKNILSLVKEAASLRASQAGTVKSAANRSPHPVIICGDFNDPPQSYTYRKLSMDLKDTFVERGRWFGFTYNGNIPFLKIDYILASPELGVKDTRVIKSDISDHNPTQATLLLPSGE
jgi:endonuclease/exonuclease/phosphatase family metal-dependent hydrolase